GEEGEEAAGPEARERQRTREPLERLRRRRCVQRAASVVSIMARFSPRRLHFGDKPDLDDDGTGLPLPLRVKLAARRAAGIAEARETLALLPGPGESLHAVMTARLDMIDVLNALLDKLGGCEGALLRALGANR